MVRWFNRLIEPLPVTLTIMVGGVIVWPAFFVFVFIVAVNVMLAPASWLGLR